MKRFYCKICQKIRHVRRIPSNVTTPSAYNPSDRIGICAWHRTITVKGTHVASTDVAMDALLRKVGR